MFDKDGGGTISKEELKNILSQGQLISEKVWIEVMSDFDKDGNGEIDFEEFSTMMTKLLQS